MLERQKVILARYFKRVSPITDVTMEHDMLCATDLARKTETYPASSFRYAAAVLRGTRDMSRAERPPVFVQPVGRVCLPLPTLAADGGAPADDRSRYVIVEIANGASRGPLVAHLYDLGPRQGMRLVALERPD